MVFRNRPASAGYCRADHRVFGLLARNGSGTSPIADDGEVYCSSCKDVVTVMEGADTLLVKARNPIGEPICATPAIADNKLYLRRERHLRAFGLGGSDASGRPENHAK